MKKLKKVLPIIIVMILFVWAILCLPSKPETSHCAQDSCQTFYSQFNDSAARVLVEKTQQQASLEHAKRNEQRNQLMGLTITVLIGIVGYTLGKKSDKQDRNDRITLWVVAIAFCLLMHGIDTMLADLSNRQVCYSNHLNRYLVKWDSLRHEDIKAALIKVCQGNEPNESFNGQSGLRRKVDIFFRDGCSFMFWWWWALTAMSFALLTWEKWTSKE